MSSLCPNRSLRTSSSEHLMQKMSYKSLSGRLITGRTRRTRQGWNQFVTAVFWAGITIVCTMLLWTFAMVLLEAWEQWRR